MNKNKQKTGKTCVSDIRQNSNGFLVILKRTYPSAGTSGTSGHWQQWAKK